MNAKTLSILAVIAVALVGLALWLSSSRSPSSVSGAASAPLFPGLLEKIAGAEVIEVRRGEELVTLRRGQSPDVWTIDQRDAYPADAERVREVVNALIRSTIAETKTSNPEYYARLGVADPDQSAESSTLISLKDASGAALASVIVGKSAQGDVQDPMDFGRPARKGVYARRAGEPQALLLSDAILIPDGPSGWMKTDIFSLDQSRIIGSTLTHASAAQTLTFTRGGDEATSWTLAEKPADRELRSPGVLGPIATLLSYITVDDARKQGVIDGLEPISTLNTSTREGLVITAKLFEKDSVNWLTLRADFDADIAQPLVPPPPSVTGEVQTSPEEIEKQNQERNERTAKEADEINARVEGWAFKLPDFKARQFKSTLDDVLAQAKPAESAVPVTPSPQSQSDGALIFPGADPK